MKLINSIPLLVIAVLLTMILFEIKDIAFRVRTIEYNTPTSRR